MKEITLELIKQAAEATYSNAEEQEAFMEGFCKEAQGTLFGNPTIREFLSSGASKEAFANGLSTGAGKALATLGIGLLGAAAVKGINTASNSANSAMLRSKFEEALERVKANNRVVRGAKPERVNDYANTIFKFAPHVAADVNLLSSILANAVLGEGIDPQTIKSITELESRYRENNQSSSLAGIRV